MGNTIISLDIGERRIGIARASVIAKLPEPLVTVPNNKDFKSYLLQLIKEHEVSEIVVGLPRGLDGQTTQQTNYVTEFIKTLQLKVPIHFQDEAVTSIHATERLEERKESYQKEDIDAWAATIILEDYLKQRSNHGTDAV